MVLLYFPCMVICWLWLGNGIATAASLSMAKPGCNDTCGDVSIPFPFGLGPDCYMNKSFEVYCNRSIEPPVPYLTSIHKQLLWVSLTGHAGINNSVISSNCDGKEASSATGVDFSGSPFVFSEKYTRFTATGCDNYATFSNGSTVVGGCLSFCNGSDSHNTHGCYGLGCCQTAIPPYMGSFEAKMENLFDKKGASGCKTTFMLDQTWMTDSMYDKTGDLGGVLSKLSSIPAAVQWGSDQGYCRITKPSQAYCSGRGYYWEKVGPRHLCVCSSNQTDNAPLQFDIVGEYPEAWKHCTSDQETYDPDKYFCSLLCIYNPGPKGYHCPCPNDYYSSDSNVTCYMNSSSNSSNSAKMIIIGCSLGFGSLLLLLVSWRLYKIIIKRKESMLKRKIFKRNGGLLLQQQLSSTGSSIEQAKIFSFKDLEKATDNFHTGRVIGQGGQGTVYKGMLVDGRLVAIKKSKLVDDSRLAEFINEVVILSRINHRNVVQLLGCCLETKIPLLVYEYIPNGTLSHHLHDENEDIPITWEMRLQIATEVANALSYLHSAAALPIYHRDIKSSNILLDEKYHAKVADFGISKSIAVDQTHATTQVRGTFGYLDPEYFQSSQFTDKSDVYSFGVILIELLTGQKPISKERSTEERSLATYFLLAIEDNRLFDILDPRVAKEGGEKEIQAMAKLACGCLDLSGRNRPTMKMVAMELEMIKSMQGTCSISQLDHEAVDYPENIDIMGPWDATSSSIISSFDVTVSLLENSY